MWTEIFHKNDDTLKKCDLRPLYFAQKCPQNAGNGVSGLCRHFCKLGPATSSVP